MLGRVANIDERHREELLRLVEELPENEVPVELDDVRRRLRTVKDRSWPWLDSVPGRARAPMWPLAPGICSEMDLAARRDRLCTGPLVDRALISHPRKVRRASQCGWGKLGLHKHRARGHGYASRRLTKAR
jgi:hypothetical protein